MLVLAPDPAGGLAVFPVIVLFVICGVLTEEVPTTAIPPPYQRMSLPLRLFPVMVLFVIAAEPLMKIAPPIVFAGLGLNVTWTPLPPLIVNPSSRVSEPTGPLIKTTLQVAAPEFSWQ